MAWVVARVAVAVATEVAADAAARTQQQM